MDFQRIWQFHLIVGKYNSTRIECFRNLWRYLVCPSGKEARFVQKLEVDWTHFHIWAEQHSDLLNSDLLVDPAFSSKPPACWFKANVFLEEKSLVLFWFGLPVLRIFWWKSATNLDKTAASASEVTAYQPAGAWCSFMNFLSDIFQCIYRQLAAISSRFHQN